MLRAPAHTKRALGFPGACACLKNLCICCLTPTCKKPARAGLKDIYAHLIQKLAGDREAECKLKDDLAISEGNWWASAKVRDGLT